MSKSKENTSEEFFCNKCTKHFNIRLLSYRYGENNNKACCSRCNAPIKQHADREIIIDDLVEEEKPSKCLLVDRMVEKFRLERDLRENFDYLECGDFLNE